MPQRSDTPTPGPEWLQKNYNERKSRAFELGVKEINALQNESKKISVRSIAQKSKEIDPEGKGIHTNTVTTNEQLYGYFKEHTSIKSKKGFRTSTMALDTDFDDLKHQRGPRIGTC